MNKPKRQKRIERKIRETKGLRDQFLSNKPEIQARIKTLRQKLVDIYR